jgi:hypothetical protein
MIEPICFVCNKRPAELAEYVEAAAEEGMTPDEYVRQEEGTYNRGNGHFACTPCYIKIGQPSRRSPRRWIAP